VLFQWLSAPIAVAASSVTYLASAGLLLAIRPQRERPADTAAEAAAPRLDPLDPFRIVLWHPLVRPIWLMRVGGDFFGWFFGALYILYALDVLRLDPAELGVTIAAGGVGGLIGAALAPAFTRRLGAGRALIVSSVLTGATALAIPLAAGGPLTAMLFLIFAQLAGDAMHTVMDIGEASLRQRLLPGAELGRSAGAFATGQGLAGVAGALAGGALGAWLGPRETLLIACAGRAAAPLIGLASPLSRLRDAA
jgi:Na+/melibiose symporter-like transporter